jgi:DNA-binding Lrp family transcriptional regulator
MMSSMDAQEAPGGAYRPDRLDAALVHALHRAPRTGVLELSRVLGVARGTVQARLDRLLRRGLLRLSPQVDPAALGYPVTAFLTLELHQDTGRDAVTEQLSGIPQVLEAHTTTGAGDLLVRVVARDNTHLQEVIDAVVATPAVARTSTVIALQDVVRHRTLPLLDQAVGRP